jgi:DedD protein
MFQSVKIAQVDLSDKMTLEAPKLPHVVKAQPISKKLPSDELENNTTLAHNNYVKKSVDIVESIPVTNEPASSKPVTSKPVTSKPVTSKPVASKPVASKPVASKPVASKPVASKPAARKPVASKPAARKPTPIINKQGYSVQIAYLSVENNAKSLVKKLNGKGYKAKYRKSVNSNGDFYKVTVGNFEKREDAQVVQQTLFDSVHLKGFLVKTGVS